MATIRDKMGHIGGKFVVLSPKQSRANIPPLLLFDVRTICGTSWLRFWDVWLASGQAALPRCFA